MIKRRFDHDRFLSEPLIEKALSESLSTVDDAIDFPTSAVTIAWEGVRGHLGLTSSMQMVTRKPLSRYVKCN